MPRSIIVPAHNEAPIIRSTLETLLDGVDVNTTVIVACNGCTDDTAAIARGFEPRVSVLEISTASKTEALNAAEANLLPGPRAYVDADAQISGASINSLLEAVDGISDWASEPIVRFDVDGSSLVVRSYYTVWTALHGARPGDVGGGVYCLSKVARERFGIFPKVISDDGFVRAHFDPDEIVLVEDAQSTIKAPTDLASLIRIKTRSRRGTRELADQFPGLWEAKMTSRDSLGRKIGRLPLRVWPRIPVYAIVQGIARYRARRSVDAFVWERDETSRGA